MSNDAVGATPQAPPPSKIDLVSKSKTKKATTRPEELVHAAPLPKEGAGAPQIFRGAAGEIYRVFSDKNESLVELPAVLAGPMVRRAEPARVFLWLCTSTEVEVEAVAFTDSPDSPVGKGTIKSVPFGRRLHVAVVPVEPTAATFPLDQIIKYTMTITSLRDPFKGEVAFLPSEISYTGDFPSFILPSDTAPTVLMQGSCRKLSGPGADAMDQADAYMAKQATSPKMRPQQLILTGDQIYGDDVDAGVLEVSKFIGPMIVGFDEELPTAPKEWRTATSILGGAGPGQRGQLVADTGITSDKGSREYHSMAFAEYMMLYLLGWSGDVFSYAKRLLKEGLAALVPPTFLDLFPNKQFHDDVEKTSPGKAQRVFANIASYMMCDDHEFTDDWNIDEKFKKSSQDHPLMRRMLFNSLSNYWLFQGWGNHPDSFAGCGEGLSRYLTSPELADRLDTASFLSAAGSGAKGGAGGTPPAHRPDSALEGLEVNMAGRVWAFVTPKPANVIMMDTRTRRVLSKPGVPPGLLNSDALGDLVREIKGAPLDAPVIIASPPPVIGHPGAEWGQDYLVHTHNPFSPSKVDVAKFYAYDYECWKANHVAFLKFLEVLQLSGRSKFVIFAGDVHYGTSCAVRYRVRRHDGLEPTSIGLSAAPKDDTNGGANPSAGVDPAKAVAALSGGGDADADPSGDAARAAFVKQVTDPKVEDKRSVELFHFTASAFKNSMSDQKIAKFAMAEADRGKAKLVAIIPPDANDFRTDSDWKYKYGEKDNVVAFMNWKFFDVDVKGDPTFLPENNVAIFSTTRSKSAPDNPTISNETIGEGGVSVPMQGAWADLMQPLGEELKPGEEGAALADRMRPWVTGLEVAGGLALVAASGIGIYELVKAEEEKKGGGAPSGSQGATPSSSPNTGSGTAGGTPAHPKSSQPQTAPPPAQSAPPAHPAAGQSAAGSHPAAANPGPHPAASPHASSTPAQHAAAPPPTALTPVPGHAPGHPQKKPLV